MIGMFNENGPCEVIEMADGSYGTQARMWGWDRSSNVLFIDQPAQVCFFSSSIFPPKHPRVFLHATSAWLDLPLLTMSIS
jgi:carboxypeptidase C (cathepsin A)